LSEVAALASAFRDGTRSPVAVTEAALDAIAADEARLNAVATLMRPQALAAAETAARELAAGTDGGPLHGVPVAVKDLFDLAGVPTTFGADPVFHEYPDQDSAVVTRLRAAGAVIVAKAQMLEFAYGAPSPAIGQTNNPHDPGRTAGGSSGGSAALVAAGHLPLAVGTDTGGSIRIPSAYCGVVGFKPSYGLIDLAGAMPLSWTLDHAGPIARSVADARLLLAALAGQAFPRGARDLRGLRLGVIAAHRDAACVTDEVRAAFEAGCSALASAGAVLEDVALPHLEEVSGALMLILLPEAFAAHAARLARAPERMAAATRLQLDAGAGIPAAAYVRARQFRARMQAEFAACLGRCDALLSPSVPFVAPDSDPPIEEGGGSDEMLCSALANLVGAPSLSLPLPRRPGALPVGLQIRGPWVRISTQTP
jgi:aspartyl-tRNA(Asn)/glutamyl-tRNA(Gln) amidotransferase subunit A